MNNLSIKPALIMMILSFAILSSTLMSFSQSNNQNYIMTRTMLNSSGTSSMERIEYFDGLGRPIQKVLKKASPLQCDIVTLQEYDAIGRPSNSYIPVPVSTNTGQFVSPYLIKQLSTNFYGDSYAFEKNVYEPSPLNRVTDSYGPGSAWHHNSKAVKTDFMTNASSGELSCALYVAANNTSIQRKGLYLQGMLYITKTTDEDDHVSYTFTDKLGQTVLERVMSGSVMNDTYYVYDDFGNLRYVLPPSASDMLTATTTWVDNNETLKNYAYIYKYDGRNRCTQKRLPGCEPIEMRYDKTDRMILSQDGNQRSNGEWSFHLYDVLGRQTVTGVWVTPTVPDISNTVVSSSYDPTGTKLGGYTVENLTLPDAVQLISVSYYDNYEFISGVTELNYVTPPVGYDTRHNNAKGLLTGTRSYRLDNSSEYTMSAVYYDHRGRIVQTHSTNHMGGFDHEYLAYTFTGKVKQRQTVHTGDISTDAQTETHTYDYGTPNANPTERLLSVKHKLNSSPEVTLAQYTYDEVGRTKTKKLGTETSSYSYNVRSWLTQINGNKFHQTLLYNNFENNIIPHSLLYNGNISSVRWRAGNETILRGYNFNYDNLNRLSVAHYGEVNPAGEGGFINVNPNLFNEEATYDKMGNITTLQRRGKITSSDYNLIDNLTYTYTGNQLTKVTDAVTTPITNENTLHFVDGANVENEYVYDVNGNLIKDLNKNITSITYNYLNLPNIITFADGNTITYDYDANGSKLSVAYKMGGNIAKTEYVGNKVYKNGTLSMILTEEGYITMNGTAPTYHYFLKDHQGNNRVVMNQSGTVEQVNHYYPFGGLFGEGMQDSNQPYKYNGKEFDNLLGLNMYDYGARHYDPYTGGWVNVDPMAEGYYGWSPYAYVGNNPVVYTDPNGMFRTKFGAWLYKLFHGGDRILKDNGGEYFVSQQVEHSDDEPGITVRRTFDWKGRTEGKDLAFEAQKNAYVAQMRFKEMALQHGFEYYETESRTEAIAGLLKPVSMVVMPDPIIRTASSAINTSKGSGNLLKVANTPSKGGLTKVGRALQKHGSRPGSLFPKAIGNSASINAQGEAVLKSIIKHPNATTVTRHHARFGKVMEIKIPNGQGARFSADGKTFYGFIE